MPLEQPIFHILSLVLLSTHVSCQSIILGACQDDEFECDDGVCIPKAWQCDYEIDCANNEDELYDMDGNACNACAERGYFCNDDTNKCIPPQWHCDGWTDCKNGDDEEYCTPCTDDQFQCNNGQCIDHTLLCDLNNDCLHGEDEIHDINGNDCPGCTLQCDDNTLCITSDQLCDGHFDCTDKTDECDHTLCVINEHMECDISSINTLPPTSAPNIPDADTAADNTPTWKYCPSDIVWLGFVHTFENEHGIHNGTAVYWIEPKVREEGIYYEKHSTSYNSGDHFGVGLYSIEYIAKKLSINGSDPTDSDDPLFCIVRVLVLDGMRDYEIAECAAQSHSDYIEWAFVVDDDTYNIAYFSIGDYTADIERARFVPMTDKYHTDCYAQIAFETGILRNEEDVVIEETVDWMIHHLYALIGLIVGVVLLFCILLIIIIILWRKHVEMKEFIRADTTDREDSNDESMDDMNGEHVTMLETKRSSTIGLDITTPGGIGYIARKHQEPYITSSRSHNAYSGIPTQFEHSLSYMNDMNVSNSNENEVHAHVSDTDSSDDGDEILLNLKKHSRNNGGQTPPRRPSILGIDYDQLKQIQNKARKEKRDHDADVLLEAEWEQEESSGSLGL